MLWEMLLTLVFECTILFVPFMLLNYIYNYYVEKKSSEINVLILLQDFNKSFKVANFSKKFYKNKFYMMVATYFVFIFYKLHYSILLFVFIGFIIWQIYCYDKLKQIFINIKCLRKNKKADLKNKDIEKIKYFLGLNISIEAFKPMFIKIYIIKVFLLIIYILDYFFILILDYLKENYNYKTQIYNSLFWYFTIVTTLLIILILALMIYFVVKKDKAIDADIINYNKEQDAINSKKFINNIENLYFKYSKDMCVTAYNDLISIKKFIIDKFDDVDFDFFHINKEKKNLIISEVFALYIVLTEYALFNYHYNEEFVYKVIKNLFEKTVSEIPIKNIDSSFYIARYYEYKKIIIENYNPSAQCILYSDEFNKKGALFKTFVLFGDFVYYTYLNGKSATIDDLNNITVLDITISMVISFEFREIIQDVMSNYKKYIDEIKELC